MPPDREEARRREEAVGRSPQRQVATPPHVTLSLSPPPRSPVATSGSAVPRRIAGPSPAPLVGAKPQACLSPERGPLTTPRVGTGGGVIKVVRKEAVNVSALTTRPPKEVLTEILRACARCRVHVQPTGPFSVKCIRAQGPGIASNNDVLRFEMDVARVDGEDRYVVRGKRLGGDFRAYKELCADLISEMAL